MNCGFEDCTVMWELMQKHNENWPLVFESYQQMRKPEGDGVQDLSLDNYYVMRDHVSKPEFLLQQRFERRIQQLYPDKHTPLYSQVSFSNIPYSVAYKKGKKQDVFIKEIMSNNNIEELFNNNKIDELIHSVFTNYTIEV